MKCTGATQGVRKILGATREARQYMGGTQGARKYTGETHGLCHTPWLEEVLRTCTWYALGYTLLLLLHKLAHRLHSTAADAQPILGHGAGKVAPLRRQHCPTRHQCPNKASAQESQACPQASSAAAAAAAGACQSVRTAHLLLNG